MDERLFRDAMGRFATGITIVTINDEQEPSGMTVNAFMSISLEPKLIAISIDEAASMYDKLNQVDKFGISILSKDQKEYSMIFARQMQSERQITYTELDGVPVLKDALTTLSCRVDKKFQVGDHLIYIAEVTDLTLSQGDPTIFFGGNYRELSE